MSNDQRYIEAMCHDFPKDFIPDSELDFIDALASCKGDGIQNKSNMACRMPKSGKGKNMAKSKQVPENLTDAEKLKYYAGRVSDGSLTSGERRWASKRVNQLTKKLSASSKQSTAKTSSCANCGASLPATPQQNNAYNAGIGYGAAKVGARVPVKDENKPAFRNGVQAGRSLAKK